MRLIILAQLMEIQDPVIWRKIVIPTELTFDDLHLMLQAAFGWENAHLYSFKEAESRFFQVVSPYTEEFGIDATRTPAGKVLWDYLNQYAPDNRERQKIIYTYDYGDSWDHQIDVLGVYDEDEASKAELLDGGGACPPEDCGGAPGYKRLKDFLAGKISSKEYYDWMTAVRTRKFDPFAFDLPKMQRRTLRWRSMSVR